MEKLYFNSINEKIVDIELLKNNLNEIMNKRNINNNYVNEQIQFVNTEASLSWILRGGIDYFSNLSNNFLGDGNASGVPDIRADQFANNFYRVSNALKYFSEIFKLNYSKCNEFRLLEDIRTLIVHSGEQVNRVVSSDFNKYKDMQLGRIFFRENERIDIDFLKTDYDYKIQVWADKKNKSPKKYNPDANIELNKENQKDITIYLRAADVRNIVLYQIEQFILLATNKIKIVKNPEYLPDTPKRDIVDTCDFDRLEKLIKFKRKGQYIIRDNRAYWDGFGLKKLHYYASYRFNIPDDIREEVKSIIKKRLNEYYEAFNNELLEDEDLPSLDVRDVFKSYTPEYEAKNYLEWQKLFEVIAPRFNTSDGNVCGRVEMLAGFTYEVSTALGVNLEINNSVDDVICDYFVKSVMVKNI